MYPEPAYLECQDCGGILRKLSPAEAQRVARNPENFIFWCDQCRADRDRRSMW